MMDTDAVEWARNAAHDMRAALREDMEARSRAAHARLARLADIAGRSADVLADGCGETCGDVMGRAFRAATAAYEATETARDRDTREIGVMCAYMTAVIDAAEAVLRDDRAGR